MAKKLVIVESPAKAKTINNYLGNDFIVTASYGHVRDLPSSKIGVDTDDNYKPTYIIPTKAKKNVTAIKKMAAAADEIYLATDLDREGEAIAWHIVQAIGLNSRVSGVSSQSPEGEAKNEKSKAPCLPAGRKNVKRITFNEITKEAVNKAVASPREIDMNLVDAQQARRVLDRLVGYNLSPLLWKKIARGLSAGRVQSVAVRLVVEREREIGAFKPEEYWSIVATLEKDKINFEARLSEQNGKRIDKLEIKSEKESKEIEEKLEKGKYEVVSVEHKTEVRKPYAPFTTSTLQQEAGNLLGLSAKNTMRLAQSLYEAGHITYMRTDSVNLSDYALNEIRGYIGKTYGNDFLPSSANKYQTKAKNAQEAHEAVRPTHVENTAEKLAGKVQGQEAKLYDLIWRRAVASQMKEAVLDIIEVKTKNNEFGFSSRGQSLKFKGWLELYPQKMTQINMPNLTVAEIVNLIDLKGEQHFTEPPARYSEATLIKALEEKGIGRPSTYAPTMSTIQDRGYVIKEAGRLKPEKAGEVVNDLLVENFPEIVDYNFTAEVENKFDDIAEGKMKWQTVIDDFYKPFAKLLAEKSDSIERKGLDEQLEEKCPDCGKNLIVKYARGNKFIGCSGFPDCKYTRSIISPKAQEKIDKGEEIIKDKKCPKCGKDLKVINGKWGPFIGCTGYPECRYMERITIKN